MTQEGGGLSPAGRFERMEAALVRIEDKLDRKVDLKEFVHMESRVGALEAGETPVSRIFLDQFKEMQKELLELRDRGSRNAQEAWALAHQLDKEVALLRSGSETRDAVVKNVRDRAASRWRIFGAVVVLVQLLEGAALFVWH